ncbi:putative bifunctional diguanylate cyclase/phosphodiesterase [Phytohabitans sp. LJ34]|uniref:putative bifunctional diguanylate cyclase/phosphodiesterase n=1 Tax=Phytohabitans sp. LJ34 TaxID=3452217 RepID=UPI003F8C20A7
MSSRRTIAGFTAVMIVLTVVYYARPGWHIAIWTAIGTVSAAAVAAGVVRNRPRRKLPWLLLAGGIFAFAMGDTTYLFLTDVLGHPQPFPSLADLIYLGLFFPLAAAGMIGLARTSAAGRDRASLLDALALTVGLGLLSWLFLIDPYVRADDLTWVQKAISIAYPLFDVLVLAILTRLVISMRLTPAVLLMATGGVGMLVADVLYGFSRLGIGAAWLMGGPIDIGWIVFYAAWGAAALHPSMVALTDPRVPARSGLTVRRVVLLALSTLVAPVVLIVQAVRDDGRYVGISALVAAVMFLLVLARLYGAVSGYRGVVSRERALREAGAALVSASDAGEVTEAVRDAVGRLLPAGLPHRVVLALDEPSPSTPVGSGVRFVYTASLDPGLAARLGHIEVAARCPLVVTAGTLFVAAEETTLATLREAIEVLAAQAALALDRIGLAWEITQRRSQEYFRTLVRNNSDAILILDAGDRIRYASPSAAEMFGADPLPGTPVLDLLDPPSRVLAGRMLDLLRAGERGTTQDDWVALGPDGARVQVEVSCRDLRAEPTVAGLVLTMRDVTERRRLEQELTHRAFHDSLTGLANRVLFHDRLQQALGRAARNGTMVGVLFIDLDDFKVINDTMGHACGDELLVAAAQRLAAELAGGDTAARLGGDEFAALVEDARDPEEVEIVAQRVVAAFGKPYLIGDSVVNGPASIGIATTAEAIDGDDLLRQADLALYVAKGAGKGQWRRYQAALHNQVRDRLELRAELDQAVADRSFVLQYQPIVDLRTGAAAGLEALVRWQHPTRGLLGPGRFIDVAEESGLIVPIGDWVIERALADAADWGGPAGPYVSINVSARQFSDPGFVDRTLRRLAEGALPADRLVLEITETLLLRDDERVRHDLARLRQAGIRVAIDDFGTGYSSLSYLRKVPADVLKIEKSFIDAVSTQPRQRALVEGILRLAHTLGLTVVAEGIEEEADRAALVAAGCRYGQGFLFRRPMNHPDVLTWLADAPVAA